MKIMNKLILFLITALLTPTMFAKTAKILTLEDCIKIGMEQSKTLKISESKLYQAVQKTEEVNAGMLPSLKFNASYTRLSEVDKFAMGTFVYPSIVDQYAVRMSLQQPVFTGFRLSSSSKMNEKFAEAAKTDLNKDRSQLIYDIKSAFWSYYKATEFNKSLLQNIEQVKAHLDDIQSFYNAGAATENDVLKVKVQLTNLQMTKIDAENAEKMSMYGLNNTIGLPTLTELTLNAEVDYKSKVIENLDQLVANGIKVRSEIQSMEKRVEAGKYGITMAESGWYPQINFMANYYYNRPNQRIFPPKEEFHDTWDLGISLSFDVWNWMTTMRQTEQAKASLDQASISLEQIKDAIILDISSSYLSYQKAMEKITASEENVRQSEENFRVTNEKFKAGTAINSDLLDAETALLVAKINHTTAIVDYEIAGAKLERASGKKVESGKLY
ncbi:MAG: hypothetical protein QG635_1408 [Bacteroidota bacterium]|nr:hypothetical protein [Bacteroidota bacterium]